MSGGGPWHRPDGAAAQKPPARQQNASVNLAPEEWNFVRLNISLRQEGLPARSKSYRSAMETKLPPVRFHLGPHFQ